MTGARHRSSPGRPALELVYLGLAIVGTVVPLAAFLPWLSDHGLNVELFIQELFANRIGAFFGWDVIISAVVAIVAIIAARDELRGGQRLAVVAGTVLIGVSLGLPLYLYFRERASRTLAPRSMG